jgi:hypothetical protein
VTVFSLIDSFAEAGGGLESLRATLQDICDKGRESEDSVFDLSGTCTVSCFHAMFSSILPLFSICSMESQQLFVHTLPGNSVGFGCVWSLQPLLSIGTVAVLRLSGVGLRCSGEFRKTLLFFAGFVAGGVH